MRIFIINLESDIERKYSILQQASSLKLDVEIINAINGKQLSKDELMKLSRDFYSNGMTLGELGCSLSHLSVYQKIIDENIPLALIMEDDVEINKNISSVLIALDKFNTKNPNKPRVILLNKTSEYIDTFKKGITHQHYLVNVIESAGTYGYVINNHAAQRLLDFLQPVWLEADKWRFLNERRIIKVKAVIPPVISTECWLSLPSSLESERKEQVQRRHAFFSIQRKKRPLYVKLHTMLWRIFIRSWIKRIKP
ncbi:glycosyltransferase family 25 protein [Photorhabdus temperata]|uniref:Beta1,4-galactosyltransferase n=1 Tax=Photorhabdus temperata J3 TaxID=1389415 RepID=U7R2A0_PHOTE|nr:glycosyltransferase family 25 protein [Photorhabdus temperata]ERT12746.1 beta1,4-galactosyltransferase [Photorhabdus temperata J3]